MKVKVYKKRGEKRSCGLHACLRHAMRLSRWSGYFPVQGLGQRSTHKIKFVHCFIFQLRKMCQ